MIRAQQSWGRALGGFAGTLLKLERYYPLMKRYRGIGALPRRAASRSRVYFA